MRKNEPQIINDKDELITNLEFIRCFDHFRKRFIKRYSDHDNFTINKYLSDWVKKLHGYFVFFDSSGRMVRLIGDYHKVDGNMYKIIYIKSKKYNIYLPLTIYKLEHKAAYRLYLKLLKNKKNEENQENYS